MILVSKYQVTDRGKSAWQKSASLGKSGSDNWHESILEMLASDLLWKQKFCKLLMIIVTA